MGAGHLKIGDKIKQADGTTGLVANVTTVGQDGCLVHNDAGQACGTLVPKIVDDLQSYADRLNKKLSQYEKLGGFETAKADFATLLENYGVDPSKPSAEVNGDVMVVRVNTQGDVLIRIPFVSLTIRNFTGLPAPRPEPALLPLASARIERSLQPIQSESV